MSTVDVLIMVDVEGALASGNLSDNTYLVDTNGYLGAYNENHIDLSTKLHKGDTIVWSTASIDPGRTVMIESFSGSAVTDQYIAPVQDPQSSGAWQSTFQPPCGSAGRSFKYSATLSFIDGKSLSFDPCLIPVD